MTHRIQWYIDTESKPPVHSAICRCGWRSVHSVNKPEVVEDIDDHHREVARLRSKISGREPSLATTRDYYREQAADTRRYTPEQRRLWQQLADELDHRLGHATPADEEQGRLL